MVRERASSREGAKGKRCEPGSRCVWSSIVWMNCFHNCQRQVMILLLLLLSPGSFIAGVPGSCASSITLSVTLVKPGTLTYEYQYPDSNVLLQFVAQNDLCQDDDRDRDEPHKWPETTGVCLCARARLCVRFCVIVWILCLGLLNYRFRTCYF